MPPQRPSPWRDLAASISAQVSEAVNQARQQRGPHQMPGSRSAPEQESPSVPWDGPAAEYPEEPDRSNPAGRAPHARPHYVTTRITSSDLSDQLRALLSESVGAKTESIRRRREEKRRSEPVRRARGRALRAKVAAGAFGIVTAAGIIGTAGAADNTSPAAMVAGGVITVGAGTMSVRSGFRARKFDKIADRHEVASGSPPTDIAGALGPRGRPSMPTIRELPPRSSAAYEPMRRLLAQEQVLDQLLPELQPVAPDLGAIADESERSLEQLAGRIVLIENAVAASTGDLDGELQPLQTSLERMVDRLGDGVHAHERLIATAATVLAEMSDPTVGPTPVTGLREAADGLQALALGMREVAAPTRHLLEPDTDRPTAAGTGPSSTDRVADYGPARAGEATTSRRAGDRRRG